MIPKRQINRGFAFMIQQRAAVLMLQKLLSSDTEIDIPGMEPTIAYYAKMLLDQRNPSAFVLAPTIVRLARVHPARAGFGLPGQHVATERARTAPAAEAERSAHPPIQRPIAKVTVAAAAPKAS